MPKPEAKHLEKHRIKTKGDRPLGAPIGVRLPEDIDIYVRSLPDKNEWLQRVIADAAISRCSNEKVG